MKRKQFTPFLRLIGQDGVSTPATTTEFTWETLWQPSLFPELSANLVISTDLSSSYDAFFRIMEEIRPKYVVDLRIVPRFDYGTLNRRIAFDHFRNSGTSYFDVSGHIGAVDARDSRLNPVLIGKYLKDNVFRSLKPRGPIGLIVERDTADEIYIPMLVHELSHTEKWQWIRV